MAATIRIAMIEIVHPAAFIGDLPRRCHPAVRRDVVVRRLVLAAETVNVVPLP
jgi:hypothetical protein